MIFGEQDRVGEEHIRGALRREVKVEQKAASSLHQFLVLRGPETSFYFNPWSGVAKSDFPDFEFVIILGETQWKFTFVSLIRL